MQTKTREDLRNKTTELLERMAQTSRDCRKILMDHGLIEYIKGLLKVLLVIVDIPHLN